jgi:hypothetical protein
METIIEKRGYELGKKISSLRWDINHIENEKIKTQKLKLLQNFEQELVLLKKNQAN